MSRRGGGYDGTADGQGAIAHTIPRGISRRGELRGAFVRTALAGRIRLPDPLEGVVEVDQAEIPFRAGDAFFDPGKSGKILIAGAVEVIDRDAAMQAFTVFSKIRRNRSAPPLQMALISGRHFLPR